MQKEIKKKKSDYRMPLQKFTFPKSYCNRLFLKYNNMILSLLTLIHDRSHNIFILLAQIYCEGVAKTYGPLIVRELLKGDNYCP